MQKILKLCSIPIGNYEDISLRVLNALKEAEVIICEEYKPARKLLKYFNINFYEGSFLNNQVCYLVSLNENSNHEDLTYLRDEVLNKVRNICYISDCGSPIFEDPGLLVLKVAKGFKLEYLGGITSLSALMMHLEKDIKQFIVYGFLPRQTNARILALKDLKKFKLPVFIMETPYRMHKLLKEIEVEFKDCQILLGYCLSQTNEQIIRGNISYVLEKALKLEQAEFVLFLYF